MKSLLVMLFVGVLTLMLVGCGEDEPTEPQTGSITVTALHEGQSVDSAFVAISLSSDTAAELVASGTTMDGECVISGLASGDYTVTVSNSVGGQLIYGAQSNVQVSAGATATQTVQVDQQKADPFPFALGNTWTLSDGEDSILSIKVLYTKIVGGTVTYALGPADVEIHPGYYARGVMALYKYGFENTLGQDYFFTRPAVFLDFAASPGDEWPVEDWGRVKLIDSGSVVTVPAGTFENCLQFEVFQDIGQGEESIWYIWTTPGIGWVKCLFEGIVWELTSYELH